MAKKKKIIKKKLLPKKKKVIKKPIKKNKNVNLGNLHSRKTSKKVSIVVKKKVKTITEKKAYNQWAYTKQKNRKLLKNEIAKFSKRDENSFIRYNGKRRKVKTVLNELKLKAVKNNTKIGKSISLLEKKFKKKIRPRKSRPKKDILGVLKSPPFYAWETKEAKLWISGNRTGGKDFYLPTYYMDIDALVILMTSGDKFQMTYNRKDENPDTKFSAYIIK